MRHARSASDIFPGLNGQCCVQGNRTSISSQQQNQERGGSHDPASISTRKTRYAADIIRRGLNKEGWKLVITGQRVHLLAWEVSAPKGLSELVSARHRPGLEQLAGLVMVAPLQEGGCLLNAAEQLTGLVGVGLSLQ